MDPFTIGWIGIVASAVTLEVAAILQNIRRRRAGKNLPAGKVGPTLSEHVWSIRPTHWRYVLAPIGTWAGFHLFAHWEPDMVFGNDLGYLALGLVLAEVVDYGQHRLSTRRDETADV